MNEPTRRYFDDLVMRARSAQIVPRQPHSDAEPNACHANCESFVEKFEGCRVVRGWLVSGGHWFIPHSVVREVSTGELLDITPAPPDSGMLPFVEHAGSEDDFAILRKGRDGGYLYPEVTNLPGGTDASPFGLD
jgi:hypothetical protein